MASMDPVDTTAAGQKMLPSTANGTVPPYKVKLTEVRVGDLLLNNVDGLVHAGDGLPIALGLAISVLAIGWNLLLIMAGVEVLAWVLQFIGW